MKIDIKRDGTTLTLAPIGKLDVSVEEEVEAVVAENIEGVEKLFFDFAGVEYISSAGIRVVVSAVKMLDGKGELKIVNASDEVVEVFDLVGLKSVLCFE